MSRAATRRRRKQKQDRRDASRERVYKKIGQGCARCGEAAVQVARAIAGKRTNALTDVVFDPPFVVKVSSMVCPEHGRWVSS